MNNSTTEHFEEKVKVNEQNIKDNTEEKILNNETDEKNRITVICNKNKNDDDENEDDDAIWDLKVEELHI